MLDCFMCLGNVVQRKSLADIQTWPSRLQRAINVAGRLQFCFSRNVVTPDEKDACVDKYELPDGHLRCRSIRCIGCNRAALSQYRNVGIDVCAESDFHDV